MGKKTERLFWSRNQKCIHCILLISVKTSIKRRNLEFIDALLIAQHLGAVRNETSFFRCLSPCNYNIVTVVTSVTSETTLLLTLLGLHDKVLVLGGYSCGLCEQNPELPHVQSEPALADTTVTHL